VHGHLDLHSQEIRCVPDKTANNRNSLFGLDHEGKDIRAFVVTSEEVAGLLSSGRIENAAAVIALQWFLLNRSRLRETWAA
jgi:ADP-ribose pyrophosphatase